MQAHMYSLSAYAMQRMAQRNLSAADMVSGAAQERLR